MANESIRAAFERMWQHTTSALNDKSSEALASAKEYTDDALSDIKTQTSVTYSELVALRNNAELIPGMFYRITDYQCTTTQENTQAADHRFDIIVQALSESTLSENASADYHIENGTADGYFATGGFRLDSQYYIMIDIEGEKEPSPDYHSDDVFIVYDYAENPEGEIVPALYKTDINDYPGEVDKEDIFYHVGTQEVDGVLYDKWRKIDSDLTWEDEISQVYALTDIIIQDNAFNEELMAQYVSRPVPMANLPAWELKYSLDNDETRFAWADTENGTGVIYYMKDEHSNECPYDFKNIQFIRKISLENGYPDYDEENGTNTWVYTFCGNSYHYDNDEWSELKDGSLESPYNYYSDTGSTTFLSNVIKPYIKVFESEKESGKQYLNNNVFLGYWEIDEPRYAYCCSDNTFGRNCYSNTFGNGCFSNVFGDNCHSNTLGYDCVNNTLGYDCVNNTFANNCCFNTLSDTCYHNTLNDICCGNTLGRSCSSNIFGDGCNNNVFASNCNNNTFGQECNYNTFGHECNYNTFPNNLIKYVRFEDNCSFLRCGSYWGADNNYVAYVTVKSGIKGTSPEKLKVLQVSRNAPPVVFEAPGTTHIILD